jgi:hypothetical protein
VDFTIKWTATRLSMRRLNCTMALSIHSFQWHCVLWVSEKTSKRAFDERKNLFLKLFILMQFYTLLQVVEDWKFVSMVLDRFFLCVFFLSCVLGTLGIIFESPSLYGELEIKFWEKFKGWTLFNFYFKTYK